MLREKRVLQGNGDGAHWGKTGRCAVPILNRIVTNFVEKLTFEQRF